jgi:glycosyltransferase involved in cell wall biosynthesis
VPLVLRCDEVGPSGDVCWQRQTWSGRCIGRRSRQAPAIVVSSELAQNELLAAGYLRSSIHLIAPGVPRAAEHTQAARMIARESLSTAHAALGLARDTPLVVYAGSLHDDKSLGTLVACWPAVLAAQPQARLWLAGEGAVRKPLDEQISRLGLRGHVLLPGVFDSMSDLFAAADLFVQPACRDATPLMLIEAMAHGLPCVLGNVQVQRCLTFDENYGLVAPEGDALALATAIVRLLGDPGTLARLGRAAQDHARRSFPLDKMVNQHLQLFDALRA